MPAGEPPPVGSPPRAGEPDGQHDGAARGRRRGARERAGPVFRGRIALARRAPGPRGERGSRGRPISSRARAGPASPSSGPGGAGTVKATSERGKTRRPARSRPRRPARGCLRANLEFRPRSPSQAGGTEESAPPPRPGPPRPLGVRRRRVSMVARAASLSGSSEAGTVPAPSDGRVRASARAVQPAARVDRHRRRPASDGDARLRGRAGASAAGPEKIGARHRAVVLLRDRAQAPRRGHAARRGGRALQRPRQPRLPELRGRQRVCTSSTRARSRGCAPRAGGRGRSRPPRARGRRRRAARLRLGVLLREGRPGVRRRGRAPRRVLQRERPAAGRVAALVFMRAFYLALAVGDTIRDAFDIGVRSVESAPNIERPSRESEKFLLLPRGRDHARAIFADAARVVRPPPGSATWASDDVWRLDAAAAPSAPENFVGRNCEAISVMRALRRHRLVSVTGPRSLGEDERRRRGRPLRRGAVVLPRHLLCGERREAHRCRAGVRANGTSSGPWSCGPARGNSRAATVEARTRGDRGATAGGSRNFARGRAGRARARARERRRGSRLGARLFRRLRGPRPRHPRRLRHARTRRSRGCGRS